MDEDLKKLKDIIADVLNVDPDEITLQTTLAEDLGADSLDLYQILMGMEEEYGITIPPETTEGVVNVEDALRLIKNAKGETE